MRLYRALLHLFPSTFGAEYGGEMAAIHAQRCRDATAMGRDLLWLETLVELPLDAARAHFDILRQDIPYSRRTLRHARGFAAMAFLLAAIGIHGLLSFGVSSRAQEIGVRIALGAGSADILRMVLRHGVALAAAGIALGLFFAYAAARSLEALLAGVRPSDAVTFLAAVALSLLMTALGSVLPAWRAVRVDPIEVMRSE